MSLRDLEMRCRAACSHLLAAISILDSIRTILASLPILPLNFLSLAPMFLCGGKETLHSVALGLKVPDFNGEDDTTVGKKWESWMAACFAILTLMSQAASP